MGFNNCDNCNAPIIWDKQKRLALNTNRPLNRDGTIHLCGGNGSTQPPAQQQTVQQAKPMTDQEQRTKDIKDAQEERRQQHREYIKNLQWNTKMLAHLVEVQTGKEAREILESMGFEEYQEEQRDYSDQVV